MKKFYYFLCLFALVFNCIIPSYAEEADDECVEFCKDPERASGTYNTGKMRPNGTGDCAEGDVAVDICCCKNEPNEPAE